MTAVKSLPSNSDTPKSDLASAHSESKKIRWPTFNSPGRNWLGSDPTWRLWRCWMYFRQTTLPEAGSENSLGISGSTRLQPKLYRKKFRSTLSTYRSTTDWLPKFRCLSYHVRGHFHIRSRLRRAVLILHMSLVVLDFPFLLGTRSPIKVVNFLEIWVVNQKFACKSAYI